MVTVGLICEGITDHVVIKHIMAGYLGNADIVFTELQPKVDPNNDQIATNFGNWDKVFKYCQSTDFQEGLASNPSLYIVIHLDADVFRSQEVPKKYRFDFNRKDGTSLTTGETVSKIKGLLIREMGAAIYEKYAERILFAIAVAETECWLLPFYESGNKRSKEVNCLATLNQIVASKFKFTIAKKEPRYYLKISRPLRKQKKFLKFYALNPSLKLFCDQIDRLPSEVA